MFRLLQSRREIQAYGMQLEMSLRIISRFTTGMALSVLILPLPAIAQCNWLELIATNFLSGILESRGVDKLTITSFGELSSSKFNTNMISAEIQTNQQYLTVSNPVYDQKLHQVLTRLYQAAEQLYGVRLEPKVRMHAQDSLNAFATGTPNLYGYWINPLFFGPEEVLESVRNSPIVSSFTLKTYTLEKRLGRPVWDFGS